MQKLDFGTYNINDKYIVVGAVFMNNGCCKTEPVLITVCHNKKYGKVYSCQCACGMWCTTGHPTPVGALRDYQTMSNNNKPLEDDYSENYEIFRRIKT